MTSTFQDVNGSFLLPQVLGLQLGGPLVAYTLARLVAQEAGAGAPSTVGGVAMALTWVLAAPWLQREFAASVRRGAR